MSLTIRTHTDLDLLNGLSVVTDGKVDVAASFSAYCESLEAALARAYPEAIIECTYSTRTSGAGSVKVLDEEFNPVQKNYHLVDMLAHAVFCDVVAWLRFA
jgi:hypothetical protein